MKLSDLWRPFRRRTFPPSVDVFDERLGRLEELIKRVVEQKSNVTNNYFTGRPYFYLGTNWALTKLDNGLLFYVNTDDRWISPWIISGGVWETFVDDVMQEILRPGDFCLDIGANMGYYTIKMANSVGPQGFVVSFEPNDAVFEFLRQNILINGFANRAKAIRAAVGRMRAAGTVNNSPDGNLGGAHISEDAAGDIEIISIDELGDMPKKIDFIKIDIEGMEPAAMAGMLRTHKSNEGSAIILEYSPSCWLNYGEPLQLLADFAGHRSIFWINFDGSIVRHQGVQSYSGQNYALLISMADERFLRIKNRILE